MRLSPTHVLTAGVILFLGARLWLVLSAALVMGMPRLGDDSYTYLWKGVLSGHGYSEDRPALQDILELRALSDSPSKDLDWQRSRITMRAVGTVAPLGDAIYGAARLLQLSAKWTFAAMEITIAVLLTFGIGRFLTLFYGATAAGIGLALLAFAVFPNQGLSYLIPSTLALGLALFAWAEVASPSPRWWLAGALCVALPFVHPIGKLYLALIFAWPIALALVEWRYPSKRDLLALSAVVVIALALSLALPKLVSSLSAPPSENLGGFTLNAITEQFTTLYANARELWRRNPLLAVLPVAAVFVAPKSFDRKLVSLLGVVLCALLASLLHYLPGYPAELASRVLVLIAIVVAGIAGKAAIALWHYPTLVRIATSVLLVGWVVSAGASWITKHALDMQRPQIIDEALAAARIEELPTNTAIVYFEADISLFATLPLGAGRHHVVVLPMLKGSPALSDQLARHSNRIGVAPMHPSLNVLAKKVSGAVRHRFGFPGDEIGSFELGAVHRLTGAALWLYVDNDGREKVLEIKMRSKNSEEVESVNVEANYRGWILAARLPLGIDRVIVRLPDERIWVNGISFGKPVPGVFWPWDSGVDLSYSYRRLKQPSDLRMRFSVDDLLGAYGASEFACLVDPERPVISDDSGLVFLRLRATAVDKSVKSNRLDF